MIDYGSKKKRRNAEFLQRQAKRAKSKEKRRRYIEAINSGNIEQMADAMGVRLK